MSLTLSNGAHAVLEIHADTPAIQKSTTKLLPFYFPMLLVDKSS